MTTASAKANKSSQQPRKSEAGSFCDEFLLDDDNVSAMIDKMRLDAARVQEQAKMEGAEAKVKTELANENQKVWKKAMSLLYGGMGVDERAMKKLRSGRYGASSVRVIYMFLLFFSDLDALGFFLAASTYWSYEGLGQEVVKMMYVMFPLAFVLTLGLNLYKVDQEDNSEESGGDGRDSVSQQTRNMMARPPTPMKYYHFIPIIRFQLYLATPTKDDIEAMFRINTLSSFSLGVAQLVGMAFYLVIGGNDLTVALMVTIISQTMNWLITLMYYMTSVAQMMSDEVSSSTFELEVKDRLNRQRQEFLAAARHYATQRGSASAREEQEMGDRALDFDLDDEVGEEDLQMKKHRNKIECEMNLLEDLVVDLTGMPPTFLDELRWRIYEKNLALFRSF